MAEDKEKNIMGTLHAAIIDHLLIKIIRPRRERDGSLSFTPTGRFAPPSVVQHLGEGCGLKVKPVKVAPAPIAAKPPPRKSTPRKSTPRKSTPRKRSAPSPSVTA